MFQNMKYIKWFPVLHLDNAKHVSKHEIFIKRFPVLHLDNSKHVSKHEILIKIFHLLHLDEQPQIDCLHPSLHGLEK